MGCKPVPVAARSKARFCGRSLAGIAGSTPAGGMDVCLLCVLLGRGLCDGSIIRPEESYRMRCVWVRSRNLIEQTALGCRAMRKNMAFHCPYEMTWFEYNWALRVRNMTHEDNKHCCLSKSLAWHYCTDWMHWALGNCEWNKTTLWGLYGKALFRKPSI
jgi:hypothetical protein